MRNCFFISFLFFTALLSHAQDSTFQYKTSLALAGSTAQSPFWMHANQNGAVPLNGTFVSGQWAAHKIYNAHNPRTFQWSAGAELITNYGKSGLGKSGDYFFTDLYVAGKIGPVEFLAGQKKSITGLVDTLLTSGSLAVSGNARPIPGFKISIPVFLPLGFTNDLISIKASFSDGRLGGSQITYGSTSYVPNTYFHQKSLYFRVGRPNNLFKIYTGINHQAIWGGENEISPVNHLSTLNAYWYVVSGKTLDYRKVGTHFGTIDLAGEWKGSNWNYFLYRQNIYDTGSLFKANNFIDGLNGIRIKRIKPLSKNETYFSINSFLLEVIGTQNQTNNSPLSGLAIFENGDYFNSYIYRRGWSYNGASIGTPLIPGQSLTDGDLPRNQTKFTNNNRGWVFHSGITASWLNTTFLFKGTYSRNFGTYINPFDTVKQQVSIQLSAEKKMKFLRNGSLIASFYSDIGKLYPNSSSLLLGYRKSGMFW
ncbi:capsule assembly Wzi family protein [Dyadobacter frigoris]|uniref:Capsule assembly Wzi family protein n=1 Tax=Dyadobacter frigoris TaxID=2576211 RepID=A0A4U6DFF4_9BACT|nr:capsule assembly Wzi family protein [Dyadobacter frigoris]TKT93294.1 capsule assembly Wzi family protein [Dyadobacter frigoris]